MNHQASGLTPVPPEKVLQKENLERRIVEELIIAIKAFGMGVSPVAWKHFHIARELCASSPEQYIVPLLKLREDIAAFAHPSAHATVYFTGARALLDCGIAVKAPLPLGLSVVEQDVALYDKLAVNAHRVPAVQMLSSQLAVTLLRGQPIRDIIECDRRLAKVTADPLWHNMVLTVIGSRVALISPDAAEPLEPIIAKTANVARSVSTDLLNNVLRLAQSFRRGEDVRVKAELLRLRFADTNKHGLTQDHALLRQGWQVLSAIEDSLR